MKITIRNIAKVKKAEIELKGITVIAGENNTGKSTVGKVLYAVFNSFAYSDKKIRKERTDSVKRTIISILDTPFYDEEDIESTAGNIVKNMSVYTEDKEALKGYLEESLEDELIDEAEKDDSIAELLEKIGKILQISDEEVFRSVLSKRLNSEFDYQINNIHHKDNGIVELKIKKNVTKIYLRDNEIGDIEKRIRLNTEAIYIDDPFVIDDLAVNFWRRDETKHRDHLKRRLVKKGSVNNIEDIITEEKLQEVYLQLSAVIAGDIVSAKNNSRLFYKEKGDDIPLDVRNLSTGLKTFAIIKQLLQNGTIQDNGLIILDEPEIHLHPEWQLIFAELIVLIQKAFNMNILLNTHSPYFLRAIQVFADKYGINEICKYYMAELTGQVSVIEDVSENIDKVYEKLYRPLQELENLRWENV